MNITTVGWALDITCFRLVQIDERLYHYREKLVTLSMRLVYTEPAVIRPFTFSQKQKRDFNNGASNQAQILHTFSIETRKPFHGF